MNAKDARTKSQIARQRLARAENERKNREAEARAKRVNEQALRYLTRLLTDVETAVERGEFRTRASVTFTGGERQDHVDALNAAVEGLRADGYTVIKTEPGSWEYQITWGGEGDMF